MLDINIYYIDTSAVLHPMVKIKSDLLNNNRNFQVETVDDSNAENAGYTGLSGVVIEQLDYSIPQLIAIVKAAHTQAFGGATNKGFKCVAGDESVQNVLVNTKTT